MKSFIYRKHLHVPYARMPVFCYLAAPYNLNYKFKTMPTTHLRQKVSWGTGLVVNIFFFVKNSSQGEQCTARVGIIGLDRSHSLHQGLGYAWCDAPWTSAALELLRLQLQVNSRNITIVYGKLSEITISPTRVMQLKQFACWLAKNGHTKRS